MLIFFTDLGVLKGGGVEDFISDVFNIIFLILVFRCEISLHFLDGVLLFLHIGVENTLLLFTPFYFLV